ncbi:alpha/beta fold hydrolase [Desertivirga xinjiangensis]|uniref:alpha/beta fold hydrolase n=1 Tax=Desertivirga xinjiangensis TaxID=539206 RepID=UPI00210A0966|nr:alpha/beta hydrolase [Pedobacter xinjiangensis]
MLKSLIVLDAGIPGLIPEEIFSPANAKKIWQFYFHAIDDIPEFLLAGKESDYLRWYFTNKTTIKDAIDEADLAVYIGAYTGESRLKFGFDYYRAFTRSAAENKAYQKKLALPILAIGAEDGQGLNMGTAMQKVALNHVQSASITECGHYIPEEQPGRLLELVLKFLQHPNS